MGGTGQGKTGIDERAVADAEALAAKRLAFSPGQDTLSDHRASLIKAGHWSLAIPQPLHEEGDSSRDSKENQNPFKSYSQRLSVPRQVIARAYANDTVVVSNSYNDQIWVDRNGHTTPAAVWISSTKIDGKCLTVDNHVSKVPGTP